MADKNENSAYSTPHGPGKHRGVFSHSWLDPRTLTPAIVYTQQKREHNLSPQHPSMWERFSAWMRYYSIQWRWDIERKMAYLLHRNWIG
jgi:hypothetical protein